MTTHVYFKDVNHLSRDYVVVYRRGGEHRTIYRGETGFNAARARACVTKNRRTLRQLSLS